MRWPLIGLAALFCGCSPKPAPKPLSHAPQRIVSLAPSVTEILYAVGAGPRVVANDEYSNYPPQAVRLPHIGATAVNYEAVVALKPDLVIGVSDLQGASLRRLRSLGLDTLELDTTGYDKTIAAVREVGVRTGETTGSETVCADLIAKRVLVERRTSGRERPSVLFVAEAQPTLYVAGRGTFIDEMIRLAGGRNAADVNGFGVMSREALVSHAPDVVLCAAGDAPGVNKRFPPHCRIVVPPADILVRPGPRLGDGLLWLSRAMFPEGRKA